MPESLHQIWTGLLQAQDLTAYITQMYMAHKGWAVLGYEFAWLILFWTLLPWRLSKGQGWFGRIWTQVWLGVVYWVGAFWLIPASQWGDPFRNLISFSLKAVFKMLLA
jgi:hypothetical protein